MTIPAQLLALVLEYGYAAAFAGVLLEGETVLVLSGIAAHQGYLDASVLFFVGSAAAMLTDNFFFALGWIFGSSLLARFPSVGRVQALLARYPRIAVLVMRFLYGTRTVGPALLGAGSLTWRRFAALDALAAALWSAFWLTSGYLAGEVVEQLLHDLAGVGRWLLLGCASIVAALALLHHCGRRRTRTPLPTKPGDFM
jgi:membrane protein DedA with SNARE-associated domain